MSKERLKWDTEREKLSWEAYACLKDLGLKMSYDSFAKWLEGQIKTLKNVQMNEEKVNESTTIKREETV